MGELFFDRLFLPGQTLGKALVSAQQALAVEVPQSADAYLAYSILGDPAAVIQP